MLRDARHAVVTGGIALVLLVAGAGAVDIYLDYQRTLETAFVRLENLARIADEGISGRLRTVDLMLRDVGRESRLVATPEQEEALVSYMIARAGSFDEVRSLSVTDREGTVIHTTLPEVKGFDGRERPYFAGPLAAANRDRLFIYGPFTTVTGSTIIFAARPGESPDGTWDGVTVATLPPAYFASILSTMRPQGDGFATLLGADGTIIARSPEQDRFIGVNVAAGPAHAGHLAAGARQSRARALMEVTDHKQRLVVTRTTEFPELMVAVGWSEDEVLAPWRRSAGIKAAVLVALIAFIGALLRAFAVRERELRDQRNFATSLIESANVMVVGRDHAGRIAIFNTAAEAVTGLHKSEALGRPWSEVLMPPDGNGPSDPAEGPVSTRDGRERIVAWRHSPGPAAGLTSVSFGMDVTERRAIERELRERQRFIKAITDNMPGMVGYWDADLRCRFANRAYRDWFGKDAREIVGRSIRELMGESLYRLNEPHILAALNGVPQHFERTLTKANGDTGYTWAHYIPDVDRDTGAVVGFFVLVTDVTALKTAEVGLRTMTGRLALATRAGGIGVWEYDLVANRLIWDERMYALYGIECRVGAETYDLWRTRCHPDDLERVEGELQAAREGERSFDSEFRILTPDGTLRHIKAAALLERSPDGAAVRMVGINYDITPLREGERILSLAKARAELANRAKSEFLANMSHEIRTPMNAIMGLCHLLDGTPLDATQRDYLTKVETAARSLLGIIDDILDFSRVEAGRLELERSEFRLSEVMDGLATVMSVNAAGKDLEPVIGVAPDVPDRLVGDPLRLRQILINLAGNAIKFTPAGCVTVRVDRVDDGDGALLLRFEVADTGIGIAEADRERLFDAFSQADSSTTRRFGGSGLGLAISRSLIGLMGGSIEVDSTVGQGSTFRVLLPFVPAAGADEPPEPAAPRTVLVVDDHPATRQAIIDAATAQGWRSVGAASRDEAVALLRGRGDDDPFDVLVVDQGLAGMEGPGFAAWVRALGGVGAEAVLVMMTRPGRSAAAGSADAVLAKPVTPSALRNAVAVARGRCRPVPAPGTVPPPAAPAPAEQRPGLGGIRLLVVEDNAINRDVARRLLEREGAMVTVANDGAEAVAILAEAPAAFDVVLMDIQMPVMDGYEATGILRRDLGLARLPVIALTAGALAAERRRALDAGMDDFITKPFRVDDVVRVVRLHVAVTGGAAVAPPCAAGAPLPEVPGIDTVTASALVDGDATLFVMLLRALRDQFEGVAEGIGTALDAGRHNDAAARLHALRGAAGNVGATAIAALAGRMEMALRSGDGAAAAAILPVLRGDLTSLFRAVATIAVPPAAAEAGEVRLDPESLAALLADLDSRNMNAVDGFHRLRAAIVHTAGREQAAAVTAAVDGLRFADAAAMLRRCLPDVMPAERVR
ncbi:response regulator [Azospirillum halopraeferens]|uniref:response regulator n=1 Tax=Azospirillum halopraeferens TaxID=34010 RepID=UPI000423DAA9|nr:response regulator [Azospirillum halopraeferens]